MKKYILIICFILTSIMITAQSKEIDIETEAVIDFKSLGGFSSIWYAGDFILQKGYDGDIKIDLINNKVSEIDPHNTWNWFYGYYNDDLIVQWDWRYVQSKENNYYIYDINDKSLNEIEGLDLSFKYLPRRVFYYKDNEFIVQYSYTNIDPEVPYIYIVKSGTNEKTLYRNSAMYDISDDHLLGIFEVPFDERGSGIQILNLETKEILCELRDKNSWRNERPDVTFVDEFNNIFAKVIWHTIYYYNLKGEEVLRVEYKKPDGILEKDPTFRRIFHSEYGVFRGNEDYWTIVKIPGEKETLNSLGLLFHPTTAVLNDARVRMREWPLLDAKHLAFLEEDEEVEVLDRSGIKVKIDEMNDYWYKIRRADGTEGWAYGYFLDLAEE